MIFELLLYYSSIVHSYNAHVANFAFNNYFALGYEADSGVQ